jgi:hypothetical protein
MKRISIVKQNSRSGFAGAQTVLKCKSIVPFDNQTDLKF